MADFPSLEPTTRVFTLGDTPQLIHNATSGVDVRFVNGADRVLQRLTLGYEYLTESEAQQIITHYEGQEGGLIAFDLPATVWSGYTTPPVNASDYQWRYANTFTISISSPLRYNISIELETIPV